MFVLIVTEVCCSQATKRAECRPQAPQRWCRGARYRSGHLTAEALPRGPPEPGGHHVHLGGLGAAGGGLDVLHRSERALEQVEQRTLRAALEHLADERAANLQHLAGELGGGLSEADDAQMVGAGVAGALRRHVRQHHVGLPAAQHALEPLRRRRVHEVELDEIHAGDRVHREEVDGHHLASLAPHWLLWALSLWALSPWALSPWALSPSRPYRLGRHL